VEKFKESNIDSSNNKTLLNIFSVFLLLNSFFVSGLCQVSSASNFLQTIH
jgi:hypothetical protein